MARRCSKYTGSTVRKTAAVLAVLALTAGVGGMAEAATNGSWTTSTDANGNFTAHIDTENTMGQYAKNNAVFGDGNTVNTSNNKVTGDKNTVGTSTGNDYIIGDSNVLTGLNTSWLIGSNNELVGGTESLIFGNSNTSDRGVSKSILIGHNNKITNGIDNTVGIGNNMEFGKNSDDSVVIGYGAKNGPFPTEDPNYWPGSNGSVVIGKGAVNESPYSVVIGTGAKMGNTINSSGRGIVIGTSVSIGDKAENSIAIGTDGTRVDDETDWTVAMGTNIKVGKESDHSIAIGGVSASIGDNAPHSTAIGSFSKVYDGTWFGSAIGYSAKVNGRSSIALGHRATIGTADKLSRYAVALGYESKVGGSAENAVAIGNGATVADGAQSGLAIGVGAKANSTSSIAIGPSANATGSSNFAFGTGASVTTKPGNISWSIAMGYYTKVNTGYSVAIGSQAEIAERSDRSSIFGYKTKSSSYYGTVIGAESTIGSGADYSFIGGYKSVVPDNVKWATIVGSESKVSSSGGTAIGRSSIVEADTKYSTALGYSSKVKADDMFTSTKLKDFQAELGDFYNKQWNISGSDGSYGVLSVGNSSNKRRIINVAKGRISADSYDAINGQQIYHLTNDLMEQIAAAGGSVVGGTNIVSVEEGTDGDGKKQYTVNAKNASVSVDDNFVLTPTENKETNVTDYNIKLNDVVTIGDAKEGNNPVKIDGVEGEITGLMNKTLDTEDFATVGRAATEEQLKAAMTDIKNSAYTGWNVSANDKNTTNVSKNTTVDFSGYVDAEGNQNIFVNKDDAKLKFGLNKRVTLGEGNTQVVVDGGEGTLNIGTEEGKKVSLNGTTGMGEIGIIELDGADGEVTGLTNTTLDAEDFATVGRAATEEQLQGVHQQVTNLGNRVNKLDNRIDEVGAGAAALSALHPLDFDPDDKWDFSAGYGNYRGENAMAIGAFYRPNEDTMFSVGGTFGNGDNMVNAGISLKLGQGNGISTSRVAMAKEIKDLRKELEAMKSAMLDANAGRKIDTSKLQLFPDVPQNHWAYEYVAVLAGNGMIQGYPDGTFDGDRPMTRYEFATMLYRAMLNGATLSDKILTEFAPELERFTVDTVHTDKDGKPTVERIRVKK